MFHSFRSLIFSAKICKHFEGSNTFHFVACGNIHYFHFKIIYIGWQGNQFSFQMFLHIFSSFYPPALVSRSEKVFVSHKLDQYPDWDFSSKTLSRIELICNISTITLLNESMNVLSILNGFPILLLKIASQLVYVCNFIKIGKAICLNLKRFRSVGIA